MSPLLVPDGFSPLRREEGPPFDKAFFVEQFDEGTAPACDLFAEGEVPVVELELLNGITADVYGFVAFKQDLLIAQIFVDPPKCEDFYLSYIRYETIFRVNIRYYKPPQRKFGFRPGAVKIEAEPVKAIALAEEAAAEAEDQAGQAEGGAQQG